MHRVIGEQSLSASTVDEETALALYRDMVRARRFDDRALALQRRGWMSGYPPFRGQEASQVGTAHALAEGDWLAPTYRSNALQIARGVPMADILLFRRGHPEYHSDHDRPHLPQAVPIATQIPHAVGVGMALNYRRGALVPDSPETDADAGRAPRSALDTLDTPETIGPDGESESDAGANRTAVACYLGDGATSEGDFHEGLNFAGVFDAPVLFLCENNGWAISLPRERQTASATLAGKASAYGFDGGRVDGNDPLAVLEFVRAALRTVRAGRPVLVESLTYRQGAHTTSDDPSRYREDEEALPAWRTRDPLDRYESYLREEGVLDDETVAAVDEDAEEEVRAAVETAESVPDPDPAAVFDPVYAELTPRLREQRREVTERASSPDTGSDSTPEN